MSLKGDETHVLIRVSKEVKTITKEQFNELYLEKRVWCNTFRKAKSFLKLAHNAGYRWASGLSLDEQTHWGVYKNETCYYVNINGVILFGQKLMYKLDQDHQEYLTEVDIIEYKLKEEK